MLGGKACTPSALPNHSSFGRAAVQVASQPHCPFLPAAEGMGCAQVSSLCGPCAGSQPGKVTLGVGRAAAQAGMGKAAGTWEYQLWLPFSKASRGKGKHHSCSAEQR